MKLLAWLLVATVVCACLVAVDGKSHHRHHRNRDHETKLGPFPARLSVEARADRTHATPLARAEHMQVRAFLTEEEKPHRAIQPKRNRLQHLMHGDLPSPLVPLMDPTSGFEHAVSISHFTMHHPNGTTIYHPMNHDPVTLSTWARQTMPRDTPTDDHFWEFVPPIVATLTPTAPTMKWTAPCFQDSAATLTMTDKGFQVAFTTSHTSDDDSLKICSDLYLIADTQGMYIKTLAFSGTHTAVVTEVSDSERAEIQQSGISIFLIQEGVLGTLRDLWYTYQLFTNNATMEEENVKFFKDYMNVTMTERNQTQIILDESDIMSGDGLAILRLDGLDPMVAWGTGGHTGHCAIALHIDGELWILESTGQTNYWPAPWGVIKTPYKQWIQQAIDAKYHVALLRLAPEIRAKFDEQKALTYFNSVQGLPYGYHNFVFGWIDTPYDNYPLTLSPQALAIAVAVLDKVSPATSDKIFNLAWNLRVNATGLRTAEIFSLIRSKNISFTDLMIIPEQDSWVYPDGKSMVCGVFVAAVYRAAGIDVITDDIQVTEFTPKDLYQLAIYEKNWQRPAACNVDEFDYCQILGRYTLTLPGYNTIAPYPHMNERCPSKCPNYDRPDGC